MEKGSPHAGIQIRIQGSFSGQFLDDGYRIDVTPVSGQDVLDKVVAEEDAAWVVNVTEFGHGCL